MCGRLYHFSNITTSRDATPIVGPVSRLLEPSVGATYCDRLNRTLGWLDNGRCLHCRTTRLAVANGLCKQDFVRTVPLATTSPRRLTTDISYAGGVLTVADTIDVRRWWQRRWVSCIRRSRAVLRHAYQRLNRPYTNRLRATLPALALPFHLSRQPHLPNTVLLPFPASPAVPYAVTSPVRLSVLPASALWLKILI